MSFWRNLLRGAAAIVIPQVAPTVGNLITNSLGVGGILPGRVTDIATGALLGGLTAEATGGDWRKGAAIGGVGTALFEPAVSLDSVGTAAKAVPAAANPAVAAAVPAVAAAPAAGLSFGDRVTQAISQVPGAIASQFTDPKKLAEMTLRGAGMLAGSAIAGSGLTPDEQRLLQQQTEELRNLQQTNMGLFQQRLQQAQDLLGEARYFDPEYFGLQSARRAQVAGARQARETQRGVTGERLAAMRRRAGLETARATGTAFDTGFGQGVQSQAQTRRAGISAMPTEAPSSMSGYSTLMQSYDTAAQRRRQSQQDVGGLLADIFSPDKPKPEERKPT